MSFLCNHVLLSFYVECICSLNSYKCIPAHIYNGSKSEYNAGKVHYTSYKNSLDGFIIHFKDYMYV